MLAIPVSEMLKSDYSYINWQGNWFNAHRGLCKEIEIESTVPHLKHIAHGWRNIYLHIHMEIHASNQTPIWFYFIVFACFFYLLSSDERKRDLKMAMMCVICHNINFQTCAREEKMTTSKKAFCKMQFSACHHNQARRRETWLFKEFLKMTRFC